MRWLVFFDRSSHFITYIFSWTEHVRWQVIKWDIGTRLGGVIDDCLVVCNTHLDKLMAGQAALNSVQLHFVQREKRKQSRPTTAAADGLVVSSLLGWWEWQCHESRVRKTRITKTNKRIRTFRLQLFCLGTKLDYCVTGNRERNLFIKTVETRLFLEDFRSVHFLFTQESMF